jgi:hypothetical protein
MKGIELASLFGVERPNGLQKILGMNRKYDACYDLQSNGALLRGKNFMFTVTEFLGPAMYLFP